ncbi:YhfG family protein [Pectobacterium aquaticum]|nr:YhfG family protein [Pectobacterium aquaticum]
MPNNTRPSLIVALEEKRDYYNQVKLKNYRDSMRLEGFNVEDMPLPPDK